MFYTGKNDPMVKTSKYMCFINTRYHCKMCENQWTLTGMLKIRKIFASFAAQLNFFLISGQQLDYCDSHLRRLSSPTTYRYLIQLFREPGVPLKTRCSEMLLVLYFYLVSIFLPSFVGTLFQPFQPSKKRCFNTEYTLVRYL